MKKVLFLMAIMFAFSLTSCKKTNEAGTELPVDSTEVQVDSANVDSTSLDTTKVDTVKKDTTN